MNRVSKHGKKKAPIVGVADTENYGASLYDLTSEFLRNSLDHIRRNPGDNFAADYADDHQMPIFIGNIDEVTRRWDRQEHTPETSRQLMIMAQTVSLMINVKQDFAAAQACMPADLCTGLVAQTLRQQDGICDYSYLCLEMSAKQNGPLH